MRFVCLMAWLLCLLGLFQHFPPAKCVPTLLFPKPTTTWFVFQLKKTSMDWQDEKPLCVHTNWNYNPPDHQLPRLPSHHYPQLQSDLEKRLTQLSTTNNYFAHSGKNSFDPFATSIQLGHLFKSPQQTVKEPIVPQSHLRLTWKTNQQIIHQCLCPRPFNLGHRPAPFQFDCLLRINPFNEILCLPQTYGLAQEQQASLRTLVEQKTEALHLAPDLYHVLVE